MVIMESPIKKMAVVDMHATIELHHKIVPELLVPMHSQAVIQLLATSG